MGTRANGKSQAISGIIPTYMTDSGQFKMESQLERSLLNVGDMEHFANPRSAEPDHVPYTSPYLMPTTQHGLYSGMPGPSALAMYDQQYRQPRDVGAQDAPTASSSSNRRVVRGSARGRGRALHVEKAVSPLKAKGKKFQSRVATKKLPYRVDCYRASLTPPETTGIKDDLNESTTNQNTNKVVPAKLSYQICDRDKVWAHCEEIFTLLQQQVDKRIAKLWIKGICPKKQSRFPYRQKKQSNSEAPGWWPPSDICPYKEPDHITKDERTYLLVWILLLNPNPAQLRAWNGSSDEPNATHLYHGWVAFLKELIPSSTFNDLGREPVDKVARRPQLLDTLFGTARMWEDFQNGGLDGNTTISWNPDPSLKPHIKPARRLEAAPSSPDLASHASSSDSGSEGEGRLVKRVKRDLDWPTLGEGMWQSNGLPSLVNDSPNGTSDGYIDDSPAPYLLDSPAMPTSFTKAENSGLVLAPYPGAAFPAQQNNENFHDMFSATPGFAYGNGGRFAATGAVEQNAIWAYNAVEAQNSQPEYTPMIVPHALGRMLIGSNTMIQMNYNPGGHPASDNELNEHKRMIVHAEATREDPSEIRNNIATSSLSIQPWHYATPAVQAYEPDISPQYPERAPCDVGPPDTLPAHMIRGFTGYGSGTGGGAPT